MDNVTNYDDEDHFINFTLHDNRIDQIVFATMALTIMILGITANLFVIIHTAVYRKTLKNPSSVFLFGLSISHLIGCCFYLPFPTITAIAGEWVFGSTQLQKQTWCKICSFLISFSTVNNLSIIALISIDRFLFITRPINYRIYMNPTRAGLLSLTMFIFSSVYASLSLIGTARVTFSPLICSCSPSWKEKINPQIILCIVSTFLLGMAIIGPAILTCFVTRNFILSDYRKPAISKEARHRQKNVCKMRMRNLLGIFGMLLLLYASAFVPYVVLGILKAIFGRIAVARLISACYLYIMSIHVFSPIIQSYFRKDLKRTLKNILCMATCRRRCCNAAISGTSPKGDLESSERNTSKN